MIREGESNWYWLTDGWLTDWLTDFSVYQLTNQLTGWLVQSLTRWLTDWLTDCVAGRLLDLLATLLITNRWNKTRFSWIFWKISYIHSSHLCSHSNVPLSFPNVEPHVFWYCSSLTNWLDWLANVLRFMLTKDINFDAFLMWIKITVIADENDWFFISDQICPADVSRLQQPGFWAYLQYCKCCIDSFVIQLLSEPDKLKSCSLLKACKIDVQ